jgi:hypothetical protein
MGFAPPQFLRDFDERITEKIANFCPSFRLQVPTAGNIRTHNKGWAEMGMDSACNKTTGNQNGAKSLLQSSQTSQCPQGFKEIHLSGMPDDQKPDPLVFPAV